MDEKHWRVAELIKKHLQEALTEAEQSELEAWLSASGENRQFFNRFEDKDFVAREIELMSHADTDAALVRTLDILGVEKKPAPRLVWKKYAIAAAVLLAVATGGFLLLKAKYANHIIAVNKAAAVIVQDVAAGGDKAILTLADGSQIVLDSAANGMLAQQGKVKVLKQNGQLKYSAGQGVTNAAVAYNTVRTPRGGQYQLVLQDGTKVWLNAASTLKYPAAFAGNERNVELTGEGYFEVAHNSKAPFKVLVPGGQEVEVLGTQFNIMAYKDEPLLRTTLVEGAIKVKAGAASVQIKPGEQSILSNKSPEIRVQANADIEQAVAWKNGMQSFKDADLHTILRQVSRWYNVDVEYKAEGPEMGLNGTIPRNFSLQNMLKVLQLNNDQLHLKFENGKITVLP